MSTHQSLTPKTTILGVYFNKKVREDRTYVLLVTYTNAFADTSASSFAEDLQSSLSQQRMNALPQTASRVAFSVQ